MIEFTDQLGIDIVLIENKNGSNTSMLKSVYEEKWGVIENE
jgi:hypothetical protein